MKEIKLQIDGQEITVHIDESELAKLTKTERARTGYERVSEGNCYYTRSGNLSLIKRECNNAHDDGSFARGDYVNDKKLHDDRERAHELHDRLEQWQALNDGPMDWDDTTVSKYRIHFNYLEHQIDWACSLYYREEGVIYFSTLKKAQEAIEVFRDELMWYYTEYRSRLDEKRTRTTE